MFKSIALALLLAAVAGAQSKPNFTGTWKQDDSRSTVRPGSTLKYSNKIDHEDPKLSKMTIMDYGDRPATTYTQTYVTDGTPNTSSDREGDTITTTVKWEGNVLVFETGEKEKAGALFTRETWTLSEDGKTLTKKIHRTGGRGGDSDQTYVLVKQ
jgi:hypothetical protein